ncbi:MAG TPA: ABC transporter permease [Puia sp.]|nr:ABC transporter permease [Puia sp.]
MLQNFFKTALRGLLKNKRFTILNVLGLAVGIATCLLIVAYVQDEWSFDRYNLHADRIYRVDNEIRFGGNEKSYATAAAPVAAALEKDFPEIEAAVRLAQRGGFQVAKGDQHLQENRVVYADSTLFRVFTLPMLSGDPATALAAPRSVVITATTARKYFNSMDVLGRTLVFNDTIPFKVTGVIRDIPKQSHFNFDFFLSMSTLDESREDAWLVPAFNTYILLNKNVPVDQLAARLPGFMQKHAGPQLEGILHLSFGAFEQAGNKMAFALTPLTDIHLRSDKLAELGANGNSTYVYIFSLMAVFVLVIACVNFMNLSTAQASNRAKEVGVRKVLGSSRNFLIGQFLTESILVSFASTVLGMVLAWLLLPVFNELSGKTLGVTAQSSGWLVPVLLLLTLVIGWLAGIYPAFYLSAFKPVMVLNGKVSKGLKDAGLRNVLVTGQFAVSVFLIIGTLVIYRQLDYIHHKDLGYSRDHILVVDNVTLLGDRAATFKKEIRQLPGVSNATLTGYLPTTGDDNIIPLSRIAELDPKETVKTQVWSVDADYIPTLHIGMVQGRNFSALQPTDSTKVIINQAAARLIGLADPISSSLYEPQDDMGKIMKEFRVIGVMKDFNFKSLRENVAPMVFMLGNDQRALSIRLNGKADISALIARIEHTWKELAPAQPFTFSFMEQDFDALYRSEQRMGALFVSFSILAIFIACLGLFGLATYAAAQRAREIGIRKILGARVATIVRLLSLDFLKLIAVSILLAAPSSFWAMHKWLQGFAYRQSIAWWIFGVAGGIAIGIALVAIGLQAVRAAMVNPVESLRSA